MRPSRRPLIVALGNIAALLAALASNSVAGHIQPASAKKVQLSLVNSFFRCDTPNTATQASSTPACTPASPQDFCAFSSNGSGRLTIAVTGSLAAGTQALKIIAAARGLNDLCENDQLCVYLSYRATNDDCPEGSCTTFDIQEFAFGGFDTCCTVSGGVCKIKATVTASSLQLADGKNTGLELHGCGLKRILGPPTPPVSCGLLLH